MSDAEIRKVESVMFQISQSEDMGIELLWKDGSLYLSISGLIITDGDRWYSIPFKELKKIESVDEGEITLKIDGASIRIKGKNAERLMALKHLILPLIDGFPRNEELMVDMIKMLLIGIKEEKIMAAIMKRGLEEIKELMKRAEDEGYISGYEVTTKGRSLLSPEDIEVLRKAGVEI